MTTLAPAVTATLQKSPAPGGDNAIVTLEPAATQVTRGAIGTRFTTPQGP